MPNRTAKLVSALFFSFLAGVPLIAASCETAHAAEDCLAAPKDETPAGSHWYYRMEHGSKRHCWYVRPEHDKASPRAAAVDSPAPRSLADAHAELAAQTRIEAPPRFDVPAPTLPADTASTEAQRSTVASRWPEPSDMSPSTSREVTSVVSAAAPPRPRVASSPAAGTLATTSATSERQSGSIGMLLVLIPAALALAGMLASIILKFGGSRYSRRVNPGERRGVNWDLADTASDSSARWASFARELRQASEANDGNAGPFPRPSGCTRT
jgi:hypothetical protein